MASRTSTRTETPLLQGARGSWLFRLFSVRYPYESQLDRQRALTVSIMSLLFGLVGLWGVIGLAIVFPGLLPRGLLVFNILLAVVYLGIYLMAQSGWLTPASYAFVLMTIVVPVIQSVPFRFLGPEIVMLSAVVPVVASAFILGPLWTFGAALLAMLAIGVNAYSTYTNLLAAGGGPELAGVLVNTVESVFLLGVLSVLAWLLSSSLFSWAAGAQRRARQLEAAAVISETASTASSLSVLLNDVVERIREAYGFYHAQVFLLDQEGRMARLEASTGRAGEILLARGHALPVGSQSVVGECSSKGRPVVVNDVTTSKIHRPNELLPDTRAELALPLLVGTQVIGCLDVQSTIANAFQPDDVQSLQVLSSQLTAAIEKARLVDELQARASENERLLEEAQQNLRQIEELNRRLTREGWSDYLRVRRAPGALGYTLQRGEILADTSWTAPMRQAYQGEHGVVIRKDPNAHIAALPVRLRGEVIGVLEIARGGDRPWTDSEIEMAETLVDRLALAIENARLYEQATDAAEREQIVNRVAQDVQEARSVEEVLQAALTELSEVLGASRGIVQISPRETAPDDNQPIRAISEGTV